MEIHLSENDFIVSKTDKRGLITYGNETFIKMSGYSESELLASTHSILRHDDMPKIMFKTLWDRIKHKTMINVYVKNRTKTGDFYWVFANVTASLNHQGEIVGYYSVRRKASERGKKTMAELYRKMIDAERSGGLDKAQALLDASLQDKGQSYDDYIISLQK